MAKPFPLNAPSVFFCKCAFLNDDAIANDGKPFAQIVFPEGMGVCGLPIARNKRPRLLADKLKRAEHVEKGLVDIKPIDTFERAGLNETAIFGEPGCCLPRIQIGFIRTDSPISQSGNRHIQTNQSNENCREANT